MTRRQARALRTATMRHLADLIDELEPGHVDPQVGHTYRTVVALDAALAGGSRWARTVLVDLPGAAAGVVRT